MHILHAQACTTSSASYDAHTSPTSPCTRVQQLAPEYAKAATALAGEPSVSLAKVDATEEAALAERFGIEGYPTLKWFVNGTAHEYTGGRDECAPLHCGLHAGA
jgi:Thioredoxin